MSGEAGDNPGLDPAIGRAPQVNPGGQPRWGRRSPGEREAANSGDRGGPTYAALDLGTNNCRLLVARPNGEGFRVIDAFSRIVRLGEGISASGRLSEAAIDRSIEALEICRNKMRNRGVTRARLVATEACRAAINGTEFRDRVAERLGLMLEVIDRETEAELAATSCTPLIDPDAQGVVLFDIGGGSSELVRLGRSPQDGRGPPLPRIKGWISLPHGVVTLAERHGGLVVTRETYEAMVSEVAELIEPFARQYGGGDLGDVHMLGTSGTVTTIAGVHLDLKRYDRNRIDGCWLDAGEIDAVLDRLIAMTYEERVASPCIGADRADLVLAGCAILEAIRRAFPCRRLRVADRGLREGMLVQMMREDGVWGGGQAAAS
ncbi:MAG: Ppx/GppA phosphatase family protein [Pseudolabrys sp.]|jgi:exopolyphosphatase/guanosine-5'-triphosphate,3'-diphosphate pyrophosphatase